MDEKKGTLTHARSRPVATNLQLGRQSWLMYAAVPSQSCAQFLRQLNMTEKSFLPGTSSSCSSSSESSAMQPGGKEKKWKEFNILFSPRRKIMKIRKKFNSKEVTCKTLGKALQTSVFGPPGSGSIRTRYGFGSGSGSSNHLPKTVRKTLIPTVLWLLLTFYLWKMM